MFIRNFLVFKFFNRSHPSLLIQKKLGKSVYSSLAFANVLPLAFKNINKKNPCILSKHGLDTYTFFGYI